MSHTPGPWTVTASPYDFGYYYIEEAAEEQGFDDTGLNEHDEGNVDLIAAAPRVDAEFTAERAFYYRHTSGRALIVEAGWSVRASVEERATCPFFHVRYSSR